MHYQFYEIDRTRSSIIGQGIGTSASYIKPTSSTVGVGVSIFSFDTTNSYFTYT